MRRQYLLLLALIVMACGSSKEVVTTVPPETITAFTKEMKAFQGFFPFYWDEKTGKIWLEIDRFDYEFLYVHSLRAGVGSNDIGLDRGQIAGERIVRFMRSGPKVLLIQPNYRFRANSLNPDEKQSVEEAFAKSVLAGFKVEREEGNRVLVDATDFFLQDARGVVETLRQTGQGDYQPDPARSVIYLPNTRNFPENSEFEALLTFQGTPRGGYIRDVTPTPQAVTVQQHHSFVKLPDKAYESRPYDPRSGYFPVSWFDYATPIDEPLEKRFITRHRLKKKDPAASVSEPEEPIIYYVDRGTPEPIRSALIEGALWWNQAFEAAGYLNAFQVEVLPADADPMDIRYNVIQWVHRSTRGWSYGNTVTDPRTGEIIKGHVTLGSLRVRQDFLIAEGLLQPYETGAEPSLGMKQMALARLRQLSAHEVGHTLGLAHNFAASTNRRASVMDYPHPLVRINELGNLDFSEVYATGIGTWDKRAILYGYQDIPAGDEEAEFLEYTLQGNQTLGLRYITDQDSRSSGSAHPYAHLWDNGIHASAELDRVLQVRKLAMSKFGEANIPDGTPMAMLEDVLVPLYFSHRYQVEATVSLIGGMDYSYPVRSEKNQGNQLVSPADQLAALKALIYTLDPAVLAIPENLLLLIPPRPPGYERGREHFRIRTGYTLDPIGVASGAANHTLSLLFHPERAARLVEFHARDSKYPGLGAVIDQIILATWKTTQGNSYAAEINREVETLVLHHLMNLAASTEVTPQVRAVALLKIDQIEDWISQNLALLKEENQLAHYNMSLLEIEQFRRAPEKFQMPQAPELPDGAPIGCEE
ncbi:MAG: zinc-dependent metalloprotease [Bacteroidia bacterium]|nr:zinc-dependent metalloprotease [Bacteroidia bacterium]